MNPLLGMNVLLDSHLQGQEDGGEKTQVRNQGFLLTAFNRESYWTPVFLILRPVGDLSFLGKKEKLSCLCLWNMTYT